MADVASSQPCPRFAWLTPLIVLTVLGLHYVLAIARTEHKSNTTDEIVHLTAGYSYWKYQDYRLHPENGNLSQRWVALPLLWLEPTFPDRDSERWARGDMWPLSRAFLFHHGNDTRAMLQAGRRFAAAWGVLLCALVWAWATALSGRAAGILALSLCALSPTVLAHAPLATSDMPLTVLLLASLAMIWRLLQRVTLLSLLGSSLLLGALLLAKATSLLILPMALLLAAIRLIRGGPWSVAWFRAGRTHFLIGRGRQMMAAAAIILIHGLVAWSVIWAAYSFRYAAPAAAPADRDAQGDYGYAHYGDIDAITAPLGSKGAMLRWVAHHRLVPESYVYGVAYVLREGGARRAFFRGAYRMTGWWSYFPYALAVKTPPALWGLLVLAGVTAARAWRRAKEPAASSEPPVADHLTPLLVALVCLAAMAVTSSLNIGHRHILPIYPILFILAGAALPQPRDSRQAPAQQRFTPIRSAIVVGLFASFAWSSAAIYPHSLAYFNVLSGGPDEAHKHLVDSNLDWGQDLPALRMWLEARGLLDARGERTRRPVYLAYYGSGEPAAYGLGSLRSLPHQRRSKVVAPLEPGLYCVTATARAALYNDAPGPWNRAFEQRYQWLRIQIQALRDLPGPRQAPILRSEDPRLHRILFWFEQLRFARLLAYLRHQQPAQIINHTILIYDMDEASLRAALDGPPAELEAAPWRPELFKPLDIPGAP